MMTQFHYIAVSILCLVVLCFGNDVNKNGLQDTDESGVANIEVELFDSDGNSIATTTTDENGSYKFENLDNGDYQVKFKIPEDYIVTAQNIGDDDAVDSDANLTGDVDKATIQMIIISLLIWEFIFQKLQ